MSRDKNLEGAGPPLCRPSARPSSRSPSTPLRAPPRAEGLCRHVAAAAPDGRAHRYLPPPSRETTTFDVNK